MEHRPDRKFYVGCAKCWGGGRVYFVKARGAGRVVSQSFKTEIAAARLADRMNDDWEDYMFALGMVPGGYQALHGFPT